MTLWNIIRDFFVRYIFGGITSDGDMITSNLSGYCININSDGFSGDGSVSNLDFFFAINGGLDFANGSHIDTTYVNMADWLSTTATIIVLVGLFIAITLLIINLFKWIVRLVSLRG